MNAHRLPNDSQKVSTSNGIVPQHVTFLRWIGHVWEHMRMFGDIQTYPLNSL